MKAIVHYPKSADDKAELARRVAVLHADGIVNYINRLPYTKEQKLKLLDEIIAEAKKQRASSRDAN